MVWAQHFTKLNLLLSAGILFISAEQEIRVPTLSGGKGVGGREGLSES